MVLLLAVPSVGRSVSRSQCWRAVGITHSARTGICTWSALVPLAGALRAAVTGSAFTTGAGRPLAQGGRHCVLGIGFWYLRRAVTPTALLSVSRPLVAGCLAAGWRPCTLRAALQLSAGSAANRAGMVGLFVALLLLAPALAARVSGHARGQVALALARLCLALLPVLVEPARP